MLLNYVLAILNDYEMSESHWCFSSVRHFSAVFAQDTSSACLHQALGFSLFCLSACVGLCRIKQPRNFLIEPREMGQHCPDTDIPSRFASFWSHICSWGVHRGFGAFQAKIFLSNVVQCHCSPSVPVPHKGGDPTITSGDQSPSHGLSLCNNKLCSQ